MQRVTKFPVREQNDTDSTREATWVDLDISDLETRNWLTSQSDLGERAIAFLLQPGKANRRQNLDNGIVVKFCGPEPREPFSEEERAWLGIAIEPDRVITVRSRTVQAIEHVRIRTEAGHGPESPFEFLVFVIVSVTDGIEDTLADLFEETDNLEDRVLADDANPPLTALNALRRKTFHLRRSWLPFQNVLRFIASDPTVSIGAKERAALTNAAEHIAQHLAGLEDCRGRAQLLHDQIEGHLVTTMSRVTYDLTIVATVFLPLTFISGLLGINVGGIPEQHNPWGFWIICGVLTAVAAVSWVLLRRRRLP